MTGPTGTDVLEQREGKAQANHPDTAHAAARDVKVRSGTQRAKVLAELHGTSGRTDEELAEATGLYLYSAAPRRVELVEMGLVADSGARRETSRGKAAVVWAITPAGINVAWELRTS